MRKIPTFRDNADILTVESIAKKVILLYILYINIWLLDVITIIEKNMTLTVEPGIYLPDKFGVRIEDTVLVTAGGFETFASIPKDLIIL